MIPASNSFVNQKRNFEMAMVALISTIQYQRNIDPNASPKERNEQRIRHLAVTGGAIAGIWYQNALLRAMASRAVLVPLTYTAAAMTAIYYAGMGLSHAIDEEEGVKNFENYLALFRDNPANAATVSTTNLVTIWQYYRNRTTQNTPEWERPGICGQVDPPPVRGMGQYLAYRNAWLASQQ